MEGYLRLRINPVMRRLVTRLIAIIPAIIVIVMFGEDEVDSLLVFSQVVLSLQLGFAVIPLIHFVSDKKTMGAFTIKPIVQFFAWVVASVLVYLNLKMLVEEAVDFFHTSESSIAKIIIAIAGLFFVALLVYSVIFPLLTKYKKPGSIQIHPDVPGLHNIEIPVYKKIVVGLDFSKNDNKLLAAAMGQAKPDTLFTLIHVVESPNAILLGKETGDYESEKDRERLDFYVAQLKEKGFEAEGILGFRHSAKEIIRIAKEEKADMIVLGAHGHSGLKDFIYGETINTVRHELKIPVLVVSL
jgi:manganese transport protein